MKDATKHPNYIAAKRRSAETKKQAYVKAYQKNAKKCLCCNKEIPYENRKNMFCNRSCAAKYNNKSRIISKKNCLEFCLVCGKKLDRTKKRQYTYCSQHCFIVHRRDSFKLNLIKKVTTGVLNRLTLRFATPSKRSLKRIVADLNGSRCSICSMPDEWEFKKLVLILDHIDGNSENNSLSNLRLVCPNCDSQLPTFKGRNRGSGRYLRRQRYTLGKSY